MDRMDRIGYVGGMAVPRIKYGVPPYQARGRLLFCGKLA